MEKVKPNDIINQTIMKRPLMFGLFMLSKPFMFLSGILIFFSTRHPEYKHWALLSCTIWAFFLLSSMALSIYYITTKDSSNAERAEYERLKAKYESG